MQAHSITLFGTGFYRENQVTMKLAWWVWTQDDWCCPYEKEECRYRDIQSGKNLQRDIVRRGLHINQVERPGNTAFPSQASDRTSLTDVLILDLGDNKYIF